MKQVLIRQGQIVVEDVPAPIVEPGTVLVRVSHSCISIGTEMTGVRASGKPLWKRALEQPKAVMKVVEMAATQGIARTRSIVQGMLSTGHPTGYSAAGVVREVGDGINDLQPNVRVACAGAQYAHHAEFICVPRNLVVPIPDALDSATACTATLGAIALQGVRRAMPTLGESFVVLGLGLLGQLVCQILKANGCRVIGGDLDPQRIELAESLGLDAGLRSEDSDLEQVARLTAGIGADGVIITAASASDEVVSKAFQMCRRKGRVVLVGDVGLNLNRADFYTKELDFFISTSTGPGRYDNRYERDGLDYPVAYVRWTENRNMAEYLRLLSAGTLNLAPLVSATYPLDQAGKAFSAITTAAGGKRHMMVLLSYPQAPAGAAPLRIVENRKSSPRGGGRIRLAVMGAGGFAKGMHLPNLQKLHRQYSIHCIVSRTGHNASAVAQQFAAKYATTDYEAVLSDAEVDAVLIATRHHLHAPMTLQALRAGKHVLVEKPLALAQSELDDISAFYESQPDAQLPVLLTGYNRRFSPHLDRLREMLERRTNPLIINYRMNAGYVPPDHWVHGEQGGGRNIGEACHLYDLFIAVTNARALDITAQTIQPQSDYYLGCDNFIATIAFEDGSLATLTYTALGSKDFPKERMEIYCDGKVFELVDYKRTSCAGARFQGLTTRGSEKGHLQELKAFARSITEGTDWPIPLWQQIEAARISFRVNEFVIGTKTRHED